MSTARERLIAYLWGRELRDLADLSNSPLVDGIVAAVQGDLQPMSTAPKDATWILAWTNDRYGNKRWQCVHWAQGGGEEQPPFRGWFYFCGDGHAEIDAARLLGWVSLPEEPKR